eukprot:Sspe_Gene.24416::Locus_9676_Transcript_1_1_Confidence_1.000_Length_3920::g.24416::m.24416/K03534/rhaM; L-rhamnose mutarotase
MGEKIAFKMYLNEGKAEEYRRRHDRIPEDWPDLQRALREAGIEDYSIFFDEETSSLFACLRRRRDHTMKDLPKEEVVRRWWAHMADIMRVEPDSTPVTVDLPLMFHMD